MSFGWELVTGRTVSNHLTASIFLLDFASISGPALAFSILPSLAFKMIYPTFPEALSINLIAVLLPFHVKFSEIMVPDPNNPTEVNLTNKLKKLVYKDAYKKAQPMLEECQELGEGWKNVCPLFHDYSNGISTFHGLSDIYLCSIVHQICCEEWNVEKAQG